MNVIKLPNGDLKVTVTNEERSEIAYQSKEHGFWSTLSILFESYSCNGSYAPFDASDGNPFVGLTSAPCVAETLSYEDDGSITIDGDFWHYADYQIACPLEDLARRGRTVFRRAT